MSVLSIETVSRSAPSAATHWTSDPRNIGQTLDLSESRLTAQLPYLASVAILIRMSALS
jgi:hypothetical protein